MKKQLFIIIKLFIIFILFLSCEGMIKLNPIQDYTPPIITNKYPAEGTTNAAKNTVIYIDFDDIMDLSSFTYNNKLYVTKKNSTNRIEVNTILVNDGKRIILTKKSNYYDTNTTYTVTLEPGIKNISQYRWESTSNETWEFTVVDRIENYESKLIISTPHLLTNNIYYASTNTDFYISGHIADIYNQVVFSIQYQWQNTNGTWSTNIRMDNYNFFTNLIIPINLTNWVNSPNTNWIHFKAVIFDSDLVANFKYYKIGFVLDSWNRNIITESINIEKGFDYINKSGKDYYSWIDNSVSSNLVFNADNTTTIIKSGNYKDPDIAVDNSKYFLAANTSPNFSYFTNSGSGWQEQIVPPTVHSPQIVYSTYLNDIICSHISNVVGLGYPVLRFSKGMNSLLTNSGLSIYKKTTIDNNNHIIHIFYLQVIIMGQDVLNHLTWNISTKELSYETIEPNDCNITDKKQLSICLDNNNRPHLLNKKDNDIQYHYNDGADWYHYTIAEAEMPGSGAINAVAIDHEDNRVHIAYIRGTIVYYAIKNGSSWIIREVDTGVNEQSCLRMSVLPGPEISIVYGKDGKLIKATTTHYSE